MNNISKRKKKWSRKTDLKKQEKQEKQEKQSKKNEVIKIECEKKNMQKFHKN